MPGDSRFDAVDFGDVDARPDDHLDLPPAHPRISYNECAPARIAAVHQVR